MKVKIKLSHARKLEHTFHAVLLQTEGSVPVSDRKVEGAEFVQWFEKNISTHSISQLLETDKREQECNKMARDIAREVAQSLPTIPIPANNYTPSDWCLMFGVEIIDADGWSSDFDYSHPCGFVEFARRYCESTTRVYNYDIYNRSALKAYIGD